MQGRIRDTSDRDSSEDKDEYNHKRPLKVDSSTKTHDKSKVKERKQRIYGHKESKKQLSVSNVVSVGRVGPLHGGTFTLDFTSYCTEICLEYSGRRLNEQSAAGTAKGSRQKQVDEVCPEFLFMFIPDCSQTSCRILDLSTTMVATTTPHHPLLQSVTTIIITGM